jgi:hypothetical protein
MDSDLSHSVWHTACDHIFSELCESRGVAVPDLGTFSIDVITTFHGTQGTRIERRPSLTLSANFEKLGVRLPAARPAAGGTRLIGWQQIALKCGEAVDRDLARRLVASLLAGFASQVAAMAASGARSSSSLDLGRCGTLRIVRCGEPSRPRWREPRVQFSSELLDAVRRGGGPHASASGVAAAVEPRRVALGLASSGLPLRSERENDEADDERGGVIGDGADDAADDEGGSSFISLERLSRLMALGGTAWAETVQAAAPPDARAAQLAPEPPDVGEAAALAALAASDEALATEKVAAAGTAILVDKVANLQTARPFSAAGRLRLPLDALPRAPPEADEWAVYKNMSAWHYEVPTWLLPTAERRHRALLDEDNLRAARLRRAFSAKATARGAPGAPVRHSGERAEAGVLTLLRRLSPRMQVLTTAHHGEETLRRRLPTPSGLAAEAPSGKGAATRAGVTRAGTAREKPREPDSTHDDEPLDETPLTLTSEVRALLEQKHQLEARLLTLELQLVETASVHSRASTRAPSRASARASVASARSSRATARRSEAASMHACMRLSQASSIA